MKRIWIFLVCFLPLVLQGCDLQPKIMSLPDSVGEFISQRYPALLADPDAQPEIYNSAATDYGVYASPELYGAVTTDDYVLYSSVSDYIIPPQPTDAVVADTSDNTISVQPTDDIIVVSDNVDASPDVPTDDYLIVPMYGTVDMVATENANSDIIVGAGDTLYSLARRHNMTVAQIAQINGLSAPYALRVGQRLKIKDTTIPNYSTQKSDANVAEKTVTPSPVVIENPKATTTRVELKEITVGQGDTLYSISRKYSVPVNDLAVMNDISAPFGLRVGQRLKVPNLDASSVHVATKIDVPQNNVTQKSSSAVVQPKKAAPVVVTPVKTNVVAKLATPTKASNATVKENKPQTSSNSKKASNTKATSSNKKTGSAQKAPAIVARSSSKFSWPVRGRILSGYGAKTNGLFNDGINISATRGTAVKSAENGVVAYAGNEVKGMGNLVIIQHSEGWMTVYAHMDSMSVRRGSKVGVGQKIGTVGTTGKVDKPQLHFEIRKGTKAYNPTAYLKK